MCAATPCVPRKVMEYGGSSGAAEITEVALFLEKD